WSRKDTAQQLGIHPSTLWRKMKRYRISSPS
ncbi:MAG: helix-turn-helix domain-containing protein, partial [Deltaproteobacteria bacterium]|nr:helix-turn-helix domain-containing protein [Deltaproteobacteria bacterium]MBW2050429.1 helix-turn-helix domain-containing protein [Deltaproteobacteria bacterium]